MDTNKNYFLPENYELPDTKSNYMKLEEGANRLRILSSSIVGYKYWNEDKDGNRHPIRKRMNEPLILAEIDDPDKVKHFWAFVVYNYSVKRIQILEITQKKIQQSLMVLIKDVDWGSPINKYDIVITREGKDLATKYELQPKPAKPTEKEIIAAYATTPVNLEALFSGDDPFSRLEGEPLSGDQIAAEPPLKPNGKCPECGTVGKFHSKSCSHKQYL